MTPLVHALAVVSPTVDGTLDDYGQPVAGEPVVELVHGLLQPRTAREVAMDSQANRLSAGGFEISSVTRLLQPRARDGPTVYTRSRPGQEGSLPRAAAAARGQRAGAGCARRRRRTWETRRPGEPTECCS